MTDIDQRSVPVAGKSRASWILPGILVVAALIGAAWSVVNARASERERGRTANALQLQVLGSRIGVAAFEAEYGDFATARRVVSEAFDGIANYGIEQGALPQDYADALARRDEVIAALTLKDAKVGGVLMGLFFALQVPVDTELDPANILPAADSGLGLEPPRRSATPAIDSLIRGVEPPDGAAGRDSASRVDRVARRDSTTRPPSAPDTLPTRPPAVRRDTLVDLGAWLRRGSAL